MLILLGRISYLEKNQILPKLNLDALINWVLKLINTLDKDINTFVISHKGEVLYDKFRSVIKFEKKNYFSQIT